MYKHYRFLFVFLLFSVSVSGQVTLTQEDLFAIIRKYHPVAKQAALLKERGNQEILKSKGNFDPYVYSDLDQKYFSGKQYYDLFDIGIKVPTWYGPDIKLGYDRNAGLLLNPENSTPGAGLVFAGVSAPILQGLMIDKRRTAVMQAKLFAQSTETEQLRILNNLFYEAAQSYWQWVAYGNQVQIYEDALELASRRYQMTKESFRLGDRAAIDTTEAYLQVQDRQFNLSQVELLYQNAGLELSGFLWGENETPMEITDKLSPVMLDSISSFNLIDQENIDRSIENLSLAHPDLRMYDFKLKDLGLEQRWKREKLKPKLNLEYNFLSYSNQNPLYRFPTQYKWGIDFSMPILLREAKGDLALTQIKIQETQYAVNQKRLEISNKIKAYYNEQQTLKSQLSLYEGMLKNYQRLLTGEQTRFNLGESSLFLINARETSLISAQIKFIDIQSKLLKNKAAIQWAQGELGSL